jgi:hypothetical protein
MKDGGKVVVDDKDMDIIGIDPVGAMTINRYRVICRSKGHK